VRVGVRVGVNVGVRVIVGVFVAVGVFAPEASTSIETEDVAPLVCPVAVMV
jgi:hypothetical protein